MSGKSAIKCLRKAERLHATGRIRDAIPYYRAAIQKAGEAEHTIALAHAVYGAGVALIAIGDFRGGTDFLETAIGYDPRSTSALYNCAMAYDAQGDIENAERMYRETLAIDPDFILANGNLGGLLYRRGFQEEAYSYHSKALEPPAKGHEDDAGRALIQLLRGDYEKGWTSYEARWKLPLMIDKNSKPTTGKRWYGEPLNGKPIFCWPEQGLGDSLMMLRYISKIPQSSTVHLLVQDGLKRLAREIFFDSPNVWIVDKGFKPDANSWHVPLMSLPLALKMPEPLWEGPYIKSVPNAAPPLPPTDKLTVGIQWAGSKEHQNSWDRNCPFDAMRPLFTIPGIRWVTLQTPPEEKTLTTVTGAEIYEFPLDDFAETSAVIAQCDIIVCIDSAVGHLAGAMGARVFMAPPSAPEFRWTLGERSPWYPTTHRLFRRKNSLAWEETISDIVIALTAEVAKR